MISGVLVTRGDVDVGQILHSWPEEWERVVWDNSVEWDISVYGRYYAAFVRASHPVIFVQDDDCLLSPDSIAEIVRAWCSFERFRLDALVANMPAPFRMHYSDSCLVGFGAIFERRLAERALSRFTEATAPDKTVVGAWLNRVCDVAVTTLTHRVLVDVPYENLPWATAPDRMYRQPDHVGERQRALELARKVRDAP